MASIHKKRLGSGKIVWELTHGRGQGRIRMVVGDSRPEASAALALFNRQLAQQGAAPTQVSLEDALSKYGEHLKVNRRPGTARRYGRVLKTFGSFIGNSHAGVRLLREIKSCQIEDYKRKRLAGEIKETETEEETRQEQLLREELKANPRSGSPQGNAKYGWLGRKKLRQKVTPKTINYEVQCINTFFHWAIKQNYLFSNPTTIVEKFRLPKKSLPKFMTTEDLRRFFQACSAEQRRIYSTMLLTGMRKGELENLTWADVHFELGIIFIQAKEGWNPKTDERIIPISPVLSRILREQHRDRRSSHWVFSNKYGNQLSHLLDKLKNICRKAGIKEATLHSLRHSFGAHLRMAGVSLADIADLMGHKDLATTQIYAKVEQQHLRAVIEKLTPLVPINVSPECVTHGENPEMENFNPLISKGLLEGNQEMAGRQGFEPR